MKRKDINDESKKYAEKTNERRVCYGRTPMTDSEYVSCINDYSNGYTDALQHLAEAVSAEVTRNVFTKQEIIDYIKDK